MQNLGLISNSVGALLYFFLLLLLLVNWKAKLISFLLSICATVSALWFAAVAWHAADGNITIEFLRILEFARDLCWLSLLILVIRFGSGDRKSHKTDRLFIYIFTAFILFFFLSVFTNQYLELVSLEDVGGIIVIYFFYLALSLFGLLLVEKLYHNTTAAHKWNIRYFCLGLGGIFIYDFYLYADAMLLGSINPDLWYARALVNAISVPFIIVSIVRNPQWEANLFVSRHVVYRSIVVISAGIYLIVMAATGYYVKNFGGTWGSSLQIAFFFGALIILLVILFSNQFRSSLKVALAKHFYKNKYDYREEWLDFTHALSQETEKGQEYRHVIQSIARTFEFKGGAIWLYDNNKREYCIKDHWNDFPVIDRSIGEKDDIITFLEKKKWILDIKQYLDKPDLYDGLLIPGWILDIRDIKYILPLINNDKVIGIIAFSSDNEEYINWEDADLMKTMGYQSASFIALLLANELIMEAKQFEAFNRLSAYVVHDIKNLAAQLSLISTNARNFRDNPEFIKDAFDTIENATDKMKRMLKTLSKQEIDRIGNQQPVDVSKTINSVIHNRSSKTPVPEIHAIDNSLFIQADEDRFSSVMEHLIQNAQEASAQDGHVIVKLYRENNDVMIEITDDGCGMTEDFINNHLFKPFDTTKGNAGMGIGVYESRDIIRNLNGKMDVESSPGNGTRFIITIPELIN